MKKLLVGPHALWENGYAAMRFVIGVFLIYHGTQVFAAEDMKGFVQWMTDIHFPLPGIMPYVGKYTELIGGACLAVGLFTRISAVLMVINFAVITFVMGHGLIFTEDQHPFLFIVFSLIFLFAGSGPLSLDQKFFGDTSANT